MQKGLATDKVARIVASMLVSHIDQTYARSNGADKFATLMEGVTKEKIARSRSQVYELVPNKSWWLSMGHHGELNIVHGFKSTFEELVDDIAKNDLKAWYQLNPPTGPDGYLRWSPEVAAYLRLSTQGGGQLRRLKQHIVATELRGGGGRDLEARRAFNARLRQLSQ